MGLTEEDKKNIPYFKEMQEKEEMKRFEEAMNSPENVEVLEKFRFAFEDRLYRYIMTYFKSIKLKRPTVELVVSSTYYFTERICDGLIYGRPILTEKMLERFDLVKKKAKK